MIGVTEDMPRTHRLVGKLFPWLAEAYQGSQCQIRHDNASPKNNHCLKDLDANGKPRSKGKHWALPDHPDEETRKAIERHNELDMKLYEAAVQHFHLQLQAMDID